MKTTWQRVKLETVAKQIERPIAVQGDMTYRQIGVRWWGRGAYERESVLGRDTKYQTLYRFETGDIVINKIWARHGSVSILPESLHGCVGSGEFPGYSMDRDRMIPKWFEALTQWPPIWKQCEELSRGSTGKNRIRPERFLEITIPLPPLAEQERLTAKLEHALGRVSEARQLQESALLESRQFLAELAIRSDLSDAAKTKAGWKRRRLSEVLTERSVPVALKAGQEYPTIGVYSFGRGIIRKPPITVDSVKSPVLYRVKAGQFIYGRLGGYEGAFAFVPQWADGALVSGEYPTFDCPLDVLPEYLFAYFQSQRIWEKMREQCRGLAGRRIRLRETAFLAHQLWLPPLDYQQTVKAAYESLETAAALQRDFPAELEALQSSLLDQAFSGNL